jgi:hypothetical protein
MQFLKQSTAVDVVLGPFVDDTDGKTTEEALTLSQADLQLTKNGGTAAQKNDATSATHLYGGNYKVPLNTTDTNTLGCLTLMCKESGALPVVAHFTVVTANWWDTMCNADKLDVNVEEWNATAVPSEHTAGYPIVTVKDGTGTGEINTTSGRVDADLTHIAAAAVSTTTAQLGVNVVQISGDSVAADNLESAADGTGYNLGGGSVVAASVTGAVGSVTGNVGGNVTGSVGSVASGGITAASIATGAIDADAIADGAIDSGAFAAGAITAAVIATNAIDADALAADAVSEIWAGSTAPSAATIADAVWDEAATGHTDAGKAGEQLWTDLDAVLVDTSTTLQGELDGIQTDTEDIQARLPAALVSGRIDASVGAMAAGVVTAAAIATDAIDADALAADAVSEIWAGSTAPSAASVADAVWDEAQSGHVGAGTFGEIATEIADILVDTGTTLQAEVDGIQADTEDIQSRLPAALVSGRIDASVGAMAAGVVTATAVATGAIDADALAADAVTEIQSGLATAASIAALNDLSAAEVNAEVVDALATDTYAEPGSVPAATASLAAKIGWLQMLARNKVTQTATAQKVYADDGSTEEASAAVSDNGTTFERAEWTTT